MSPVVEASPSQPYAGTRGRDRTTAWCVSAAIAVATLLAYRNSLSGPFLYDDKGSITYNASLRHLTDLPAVLHPPGDGATVSGRPMLNLTLALNYAAGGLNVSGYHLVNLGIHLAGGWLVFGLVRRLLETIGASRDHPLGPMIGAGAAALLWTVHPVQTEAVTYIVQRAESLMAFWYLLTLYAFVRSQASPRAGRWRALAVVSCLCGMATKENMVSAPLVVLLLDRAFFSGSFVAAWRARRGFYLGLGATWLLLAGLVMTTGGDRGGSVGFDVGTRWSDYLLTQFPALTRYAALSVWPHPLVFDYGPLRVPGWFAVLGPAIAVLAALAAALYAVWRYPRAGCAAALAFAVLAPTSLVPGTTQMIVEHRLYLPLAALAAAVPLALRGLGVRWVAATAVAAAGAFVITTAARNRTYRSEAAIWADTVAKRPDNAIAHSSYGAALADLGRREEAMREDRRALELKPDHATTLTNLGIMLSEAGRPAEALAYVRRALELEPRQAQAQLNLGVTLDLLHRAGEALPHYAAAVQANPLLPAAQNDYGDALSRAGRHEEGIKHLRRALELQPNYREVHLNLASALVRQHRVAEGQAEFAAGVALRPNDGSAHLTWANFLCAQGLTEAAFAAYRAALALLPAEPEAHYSYATALAAAARYDEARQEFEAALHLRPAYPEAENNLGNVLLTLDLPAAAVPHYQAAARLRPENAMTRNNLGLALARCGRIQEAEPEFAAAVRLAPDYAEARANLDRAREQLGLVFPTR